MAQEKKEPSRRDFIKTLAGLGLGAAMAQTLYSSLNPKQRAQLVAWAQSFGKPMTYAELGRLIDAAAWDDVVRAVRYQPASYIIYQAPDGSYQAKNGNTGQIEFSGTDAASVIQNVLPLADYIFIKEGTYNVVINLVNMSNKTIRGVYGKTILRCNSSYNAAIAIGNPNQTTISQSNIVIEDLVLDGGYPTFTNSSGLGITESANVRVNRVIFQNAGGRLYINTWSTTAQPLQNIHFRDCIFNGTSITLGGIVGGSIKNCYFTGTFPGQNSVIDLSYREGGTSTLVEDFSIKDNIFRDITGPNMAYCITGFIYTRSVRVANNRMFNIAGAGMVVDGTLPSDAIMEDIQIIGNRIEGADRGISVPNAFIYRNYVRKINNWGIGSAPGSKIVENIISNTNQIQASNPWDKGCILVYYTQNVIVRGNKCYDTQPTPTTPYGIFITSSSNVICHDNELIGPFIQAPLNYDYAYPSTNTVVLRNRGFNPQGFAITTPAVPASGTAKSNTFPFPVIVYLYGGTVTQITINGQVVLSSGTGISLTGQSFTLNPGDTIAITYTAAPTWKWYGL